MNTAENLDVYETLIEPLSAKPGVVTRDEYRKRQQGLLEKIDLLTQPISIVDEASYAKARRIKSLLGSLFCYCLNTENPLSQKVGEAEDGWGRALSKYNDRLLIKDHETRCIARYLCWGRYYWHIDIKKVLDEAKDRNILRQGMNEGTGLGNGRLLVVGLKMQVGDNVFTVDYLGRHHRQYCHTIGRQAFHLNQSYEKSVDDAWLSDIPVIGDDYELTWVHDGKYAARPIRLRKTEKSTILKMFG